jgi:ABC-type nitrate/sulfonate/bicarbonate transport system substrate-binding protein
MGSRLRVSRPALGAGFAPIHYAYEKELFKQEGIDLEVVSLEGGPACASSLMSGEVHLTYALGPLLRSAMRGGSKDFRAISGLSKQIGFSIVGRADFNSIHDLRGKSIESPLSDWSGGTYLRYVLGQLGLEGEIKLAYNYVTQEQRLEGLLNGEFDAGLLATEKVLVAEEHGFRALVSLGEAIPGVCSTAVLTTLNLTQDRREDLKKVIRAIKRGIQEIQNFREESVNYFASRFSLTRNAAASYHRLQAANWSVDLDPVSIQKEIDIGHMVHGLPRIRAGEVIDLTLLREIVELEASSVGFRLRQS